MPHFLALGPIYFLSGVLYFAGLTTAAITRSERYHEFYAVFRPKLFSLDSAMLERFAKTCSRTDRRKVGQILAAGHELCSAPRALSFLKPGATPQDLNTGLAGAEGRDSNALGTILAAAS